MAAEGVFCGCLIGRIYVEALCDAVASDLNAIGVFRLQRTVLGGGGEEVDDSQRQALARVGLEN